MNIILCILMLSLGGCVSVGNSKPVESIPQWIDPDTLLEKKVFIAIKPWPTITAIKPLNATKSED